VDIYVNIPKAKKAIFKEIEKIFVPKSEDNNNNIMKEIGFVNEINEEHGDDNSNNFLNIKKRNSLFKNESFIKSIDNKNITFEINNTNNLNEFNSLENENTPVNNNSNSNSNNNSNKELVLISKENYLSLVK